MGPKPDLDLPLGSVGALVGLWSAHQITRLPSVADKRLGRWALLIMLPMWLGFGLPSSAARLQELHSFRAGSTTEEVTASVVEKERSSDGRFHTISATSPPYQDPIRLRVDPLRSNKCSQTFRASAFCFNGHPMVQSG